MAHRALLAGVQPGHGTVWETASLVPDPSGLAVAGVEFAFHRQFPSEIRIPRVSRLYIRIDSVEVALVRLLYVQGFADLPRANSTIDQCASVRGRPADGQIQAVQAACHPVRFGQRALRGAFDEGEFINQAGQSAGQSPCLAGAEADLLTGASASIDRVWSASRAEAGATSWRGRPKRNAAACVHAESDVFTVQIAARSRTPPGCGAQAPAHAAVHRDSRRCDRSGRRRSRTTVDGGRRSWINR